MITADSMTVRIWVIIQLEAFKPFFSAIFIFLKSLFIKKLERHYIIEKYNQYNLTLSHKRKVPFRACTLWATDSLQAVKILLLLRWTICSCQCNRCRNRVYSIPRRASTIIVVTGVLSGYVQNWQGFRQDVEQFFREGEYRNNTYKWKLRCTLDV